jgi:hypothetical protein
MTDIGVVSVAKRAAVAIARGEIDQTTLAKLQQRLAQEQFPNDSMGVALAKFFATPHGAEMLNRGLQKNYTDMQKRGALGGYEPVGKAFGNETPGPAVFDKAVELLMAARNCSRDAAITEIYRAEKLAKAFGNPASRQSEFENPDVTRKPGDTEELDRGDTRVEDESEPKDLAVRIKELMNGPEKLTYEQAISRLHIAEKMRKGFLV